MIRIKQCERIQPHHVCYGQKQHQINENSMSSVILNHSTKNEYFLN